MALFLFPPSFSWLILNFNRRKIYMAYWALWVCVDRFCQESTSSKCIHNFETFRLQLFTWHILAPAHTRQSTNFEWLWTNSHAYDVIAIFRAKRSRAVGGVEMAVRRAKWRNALDFLLICSPRIYCFFFCCCCCCRFCLACRQCEWEQYVVKSCHTVCNIHPIWSMLKEAYQEITIFYQIWFTWVDGMRTQTQTVFCSLSFASCLFVSMFVRSFGRCVWLFCPYFSFIESIARWIKWAEKFFFLLPSFAQYLCISKIYTETKCNEMSTIFSDFACERAASRVYISVWLFLGSHLKFADKFSFEISVVV